MILWVSDDFCSTYWKMMLYFEEAEEIFNKNEVNLWIWYIEVYLTISYEVVFKNKMNIQGGEIFS